jgi:hypothetical protein
MSKRTVDEATLKNLIDLAKFDLPAERRAMVMGLYNGLLEGFDAYDSFNIKEVPPAHTFTARWEE